MMDWKIRSIASAESGPGLAAITRRSTCSSRCGSIDGQAQHALGAHHVARDFGAAVQHFPQLEIEQVNFAAAFGEQPFGFCLSHCSCPWRSIP